MPFLFKPPVFASAQPVFIPAQHQQRIVYAAAPATWATLVGVPLPATTFVHAPPQPLVLAAAAPVFAVFAPPPPPLLLRPRRFP